MEAAADFARGNGDARRMSAAAPFDLDRKGRRVVTRREPRHRQGDRARLRPGGRRCRDRLAQAQRLRDIVADEVRVTTGRRGRGRCLPRRPVGRVRRADRSLPVGVRAPRHSGEQRGHVAALRQPAGGHRGAYATRLSRSTSRDRSGWVSSPAPTWLNTTVARSSTSAPSAR